DLLGEDSLAAYRAMWQLAAVPAQVVPLIKERLAQQPTPERVRRLIADLDHARFRVREAAVKELAALGQFAEPFLVEANRAKPSAEARQKIEALLEAIKQSAGMMDPQQRRQGRALQVLEWMGTPAAGQLLAALAARDPHSNVGKQAKAAHARLALRLGEKP